MNFQCAGCQSRISFDETKLSPGKEIYRIQCPRCKNINQLPATLIFKPKFKETKVSIDTAHLPKELGWIVVHDENTYAQTYPLKLGRNIVGRSSESKPCDVMIETEDGYMSRHHSIIEVVYREGGQLLYLISDVSSTNGTFINASVSKRLNEYDQIYLSDGDTIQMGRTKMVLKTLKTVPDAQNAAEKVGKTDYNKTIAIE